MKMLYLPEGMLREQSDNNAILCNPEALKMAAQSEQILEATAVRCDENHNLIVAFPNHSFGKIPREEGAIGIREGTARDIAMISRVNKAVSFVVLGFESDGTPILSRRRAQELCQQNYLNHLRPGDVIPAIVTHLENYGSFVDIGCGIPSLIPIDAISISRISHPKDRFQSGQQLYAVVKGVESSGRICLSHKELLGSWEENVIDFHPGETVCGIVRSVEPYGIFVELAPNLAGLAEYKPDVFVGQSASVYIKNLLPEKMKIKLIIVDSFDTEVNKLPLRYYITGGHIDHWRYSPEHCSKIIETSFETALE